MNNWLAGLEAVMQVQPLLLLMFGVLVGVIVGALPGLTATMSVAVLLPFTFSLEPLPGLMLLLGVYAGALYAGSIPAILIRTPGTPSAAATLLDGYPMSAKGEAGRALTIAVVASVIGGLVGVVLLGWLAPVLADVSLLFSAPDYFMISLFALTIIASISEGQVTRGLISGLLGVLIATVGLDPLQGVTRFTFGIRELSGGLALIPVLIGLFGIGEALNNIASIDEGRAGGVEPGSFRLPRALMRRITKPILGSSFLGFWVGVLPGVGGDIGSFVAYNEARRFSKDKSQFGKGDPRGLAAAESANNASTAGALAPLLTLGIPGDAVGAILIGALTVHGLRPGAHLFTGEPGLVYGIFVGFFVAYLMILVVGLMGSWAWARVVRVPTRHLWPAVLVISVVGSFAVRNSTFDVYVMLLAGVLGFLMTRYGYPLAPLVIGMILGPLLETTLRRTLIVYRGGYAWLLEPLPLVFMVLTVASLVLASRRPPRDSVAPVASDSTLETDEPKETDESTTVGR